MIKNKNLKLGFVIVYLRSDDKVEIINTPQGKEIIGGKWQVDTDESGCLATYEELEEALDRIKDIRSKGGDACLMTIIE